MARINETVEITRKIDKHRTQVFTFLRVSKAKAKKLAVDDDQLIYVCPSMLNPEPDSSLGIYLPFSCDSFDEIVKDLTSKLYHRQMLNEMNGKTIAFYTLEKTEVKSDV